MANEEGEYARGEEHHWDNDIFPQSKHTHGDEWDDPLGLDLLPDSVIAMRYGGFYHWRYRHPGPTGPPVLRYTGGLVTVLVHRRRFFLPPGGSITLGRGRAKVYTRQGEIAVDYRYPSATPDQENQ